MEQADPDVDGGFIIQAFQPGYELYGRVIRPAMVVVAAKGSGSAKGSSDPNAGAPANDTSNGYAKANGAAAGGAFDTKA
jgi:molecular chaperone GrpE